MKTSSVNTKIDGDLETIPLVFSKSEPSLWAGNPLSMLCFWPVTRLLAIDRPLVSADLWLLEPENQSENIKKQLGSLWEYEKATPQPSLASAVFRSCQTHFVLCLLLGLLNVGWGLLAPITMPYLIAYLDPRSTQADWWGWAFIGGILLAAVVSALFTNHSFLILSQIAVRIMAGLQLMIYEKVLKIPVPENSGKIINLMTSDTEVIANALPLIGYSLTTPLQLVVVIYLLWGQIGPFCFVPFAVLVVIIPISGCLGFKMYDMYGECQSAKDQRIKLINELMNSIRVVKFYAWEEAFLDKIGDARTVELALLKSMYLWATAMYGMIMTAPDVATAITFILFSIFNQPTVSILFTSLNLFDQLRYVFTMLPMTLTELAQLFVSMNRIQDFLMTEELPPKRTHLHQFEKPRMEITHGSFSWKNDKESLVLSDINFRVDPGQLVMIAGPVGSGKSSLAHALLGETPQISGETNVVGETSYASQLAWIQNATIRDNITFGKSYDPIVYSKVIEACDLVADLAQFPNGDLTEIGERGINLSGGQKQRVAIARALYSDSKNYIFDDPLSAVDAHVGKHLFYHVMQNYLKEKAVVLITNQLQYLPHASSIIFLEKGKITAQGTFDELMQQKGDFYNLMNEHGVFKEEEQSEAKSSKAHNINEQSEKDALIQDEEKESGQVSTDVYLYFLWAGGLIFFAAMVLLALHQSSLTAATWWLQYWPQDQAQRAGTPEERPNTFYIAIYTALNFFSSFFIVTFFICFLLFGISASHQVHKGAIKGVLYSPSSFFDTTPIGRITSRFSTDMQIIDLQLIVTGFTLFTGGVSIIGVLVAMGFGSPFVLCVVPVFAIIYFLFQKRYRVISIQLQRLEAVSRSPLYSHFSETLNGVTTIRAWNGQERCFQENIARLDAHNRDWLALKYASSWFGLFLAHIGNALQALCYCSIIITRSYFRHTEFYDVGLMAISLSLAPAIVMQLRSFSEGYTNVENEMNAVERVKLYSELPPESITKTKPPAQWPSKGRIQFEDVMMRYLPNKPLVLKGLSADIAPFQKVGIVGRTGAGKSSLFQVMFRMIELDSGHIKIDGIDIASIELPSLRRNISIIPQDPTLFIGTLRYNLDPFNQYSDSDIWKALELAHLNKYIQELPNQLEESVQENGTNYSVGQRQLLCMARALLSKPKILLMDEATANVDMDTDRAIQSTIRSAFTKTTLLVIAHRLNSIMDLDKIMVIDDGKVSEFGTPSELLRKGGLLSQLVEASGQNSSAHLKKMAGFDPLAPPNTISNVEETADDGSDLVPLEED